jgi:hypothetical protein
MTTFLPTLQRAFRACPEPAPLPSADYGFADARNVVRTSESARAWQTHLTQYLEAFAPASLPETELVEQIASLAWRISRLLAAETYMMDHSQPVPASLYQGISSLQAGYQIAVDCLAKIPALTNLPPAPSSQPGTDSGGKKVVILVKPGQQCDRRAAPVPSSTAR